MIALSKAQSAELLSAGVPLEDVEGFSKTLQTLDLSQKANAKEMRIQASQAHDIYRAAVAILESCPPKLKRDSAQRRGADVIQGILRDTRNAFSHTYGDILVDQITRGYTRSIRVEDLVCEAAEICPGLCPTQKELEAEREKPLAEKDGIEIAQADFLAHAFANRKSGLYLIYCMLQPLRESHELLGKFQRDGVVDLGTARVEKRGALGCVYYSNVRYLNAEDNSTVIPLETAVDLILLDPEIEIGLLRGNVVEHPKYRGKRIFSAGLNLTHLYDGKIPMIFYITRELGFVNKMYRGLAGRVFAPDRPEETLEKPWMAALETFAIGGGCQVLLVMDYVIAEEGSYFNLPARKEGIIPGVAPLRFSRFVGERAAQQGILFDKSFPVSSPEAHSIINEVVPAGQMDTAIDRVAALATGAGLVSFGANRKAIRLAKESPDLFREYMALYCREQANCHFSPVLIQNLERNWNAPKKRIGNKPANYI